MAIDLYEPKSRNRLLDAVKKSREALAPFRKNRVVMLKDFVGSYYSDNGAEYETLVNLVNQTADIYTTALAAENPRVIVTVNDPSLRPYARKYKESINKLICDLHLNKTLQNIVLDAFFCIGCAKVCLVDAGQKEIEKDVWYDPGKPWVERISTDDLVIDMAAKSLSKMRYAGDMYRVPLDDAKNEPTFDKAVRKQLVASAKFARPDTGTDVARDIANGQVVDHDEIEPMVWLMDLWINELNVVATFEVNEGGTDKDPLIVRDWKGSKGGPYKYLGFLDVPDNTMPSAPAQNIKGLFDLNSSLWRKIAKRVDAMKDNPVYQPGGEDDADRIRTAGDGQWCKVRDVQNLGVVKTGGVDAGLMNLQTTVLEIFDRMGGNVKAMAGLGAQDPTLGQSEITQQQVSRKEGSMLAKVVNFTGDICSDLGDLMWDSKDLEIPVKKELGQTGVYEDLSWKPGERNGTRHDYDLTVIPYSTMYRPPMQRAATVMQTLQSIAPLWPMFQQSGAMINAQRLTQILAEYQDMPEIAEVITFGPPPDSGEGGGDDGAGKPAMTTRRTIRQGAPGQDQPRPFQDGERASGVMVGAGA